MKHTNPKLDYLSTLPTSPAKSRILARIISDMPPAMLAEDIVNNRSHFPECDGLSYDDIVRQAQIESYNLRKMNYQHKGNEAVKVVSPLLVLSLVGLILLVILTLTGHSLDYIPAFVAGM